MVLVVWYSLLGTPDPNLNLFRYLISTYNLLIARHVLSSRKYEIKHQILFQVWTLCTYLFIEITLQLHPHFFYCFNFFLILGFIVSPFWIQISSHDVFPKLSWLNCIHCLSYHDLASTHKLNHLTSSRNLNKNISENL